MLVLDRYNTKLVVVIICNYVFEKLKWNSSSPCNEDSVFSVTHVIYIVMVPFVVWHCDVINLMFNHSFCWFRCAKKYWVRYNRQLLNEAFKNCSNEERTSLLEKIKEINKTDFFDLFKGSAKRRPNRAVPEWVTVEWTRNKCLYMHTDGMF